MKDNINKDIVKRVTLVEDGALKQNIVNNFVDNYWYAPQDCLLRGVESLIWAKRYFKPPVLDIGTGDGKNSRFMFAMNQIIDIGIDIDSEAISKSRKWDTYRRVIEGDATNLSFSNGRFNTVISHSTFEHIKDDIKAVEEVARVLSSTGIFYVTVPHPNHQKFLKATGISEKQLELYNMRVKHHRYRHISEWGDVFSKNGLSLVYSKTYFSREVQEIWYKYHRLATFKPYKRELWSYLKDSPYGKMIPSWIVKPILKIQISGHIENAYNGPGAWSFMIAQKK